MSERSLKDLIVERSEPEPNTGCWLWKLRGRLDGYADITIKGRTWKAHRASWEVFRGPVPDGLCVLHRCDVPSCVNPDHLFLGTHLDNMKDKVAKGRQAAGESFPPSKLTAELVKEIRSLLERGLSKSAIARMFSVTQPAIHDIARGATWKGVA